MKKELVVIILANVFSAVGMGIFAPVYTLFSQRIEASYLDISTAFGVFWVAVALLEIPFGHLSDRYGKKKFIIIGGIVSAVGSLLYLIIQTPIQLFMVEIFSGIATSMQTPAIESIISESSSKKNRGRTFGLFNSSINFSYGLASIFSGVIVTLLGMSSIFFISSALSVCSTAVVCKIKK
jgi:MFS family permease